MFRVCLPVFILIAFSNNAAGNSSNQKRSGEDSFKAKYNCSYSVKFIVDTVKMTQGVEDKFIIYIGDDMVFGYSYLISRLGYLMFYGQKAGFDLIESMKNGNLDTYYSSDIGKVKLYKDYKENTIRVIDNISSYIFRYDEELIPQNWTIREDTMSIYGYSCQKAECDYRGRSYEAWFAHEIPISEGPWKFFGLPGLILKLYDTKHHYEFELDELKETEEIIDMDFIYPNNFGKERQQGKIQKTERIIFLRTKFGEQVDAIINAEMAKIGLSNEGKKTFNYDYIELDYK